MARLRTWFSRSRLGLFSGGIVSLLAFSIFFSGYAASTADALSAQPKVLAEMSAVTPLLSYQGRLLDPATGAPKPNGTYTFVFRVYNVATGGSELWTETKDLNVSNGLFVTLLGDTTPLPTTIFTGQNLWLGIKVGADDESTPRQRLAPVAYAMYADNADRLDGKDSTEFAAASHNHDSRYYTKSQSDGLFVDAKGDAMSGSSANPILSVDQTGAGIAISGQTAASGNGIAAVRGMAGVPGVTITGKYGVLGQSDTGKGVVGSSRDDMGVFGWSTNSYGVRGEGPSTANGGVYGTSFNGGAGTSGVYGQHTATTGTVYGVRGQSASSSGYGVYGHTTATSGATYGVYGLSSSTNNGAGVRGIGPYVGVWGTATSTSGVNWGVYGTTNSAGGYGGFFSAPSGGVAGRFIGNVQVTGSVSKSSGTFKIDHPLDPENKYLYHSFVESPDMMNVYNGNTTLDANGEAWVDLPAYFEALNRDFRYQLTPIGGPGPNLYIAEGVQNNLFKIAGGSPGLQVSWQVTGIRQDPYAQANPIVVEVEKPVEERGSYLHPEAHGQDQSRGLDFRLHQEPLQLMEEPAGARALDDNQPSLDLSTQSNSSQ
jgi:hypothetical protein